MKDGRMKGNTVAMRRINELALVPEVPVIRPDAGIRGDFVGLRLLAISRKEKFHETYDSLGRYAIFVEPDPKDAEKFMFGSFFLPSEMSRKILGQIPDFDPSAQPLAFDNVAQLEREEQERDRKTVEYLTQKNREGKLRQIKDILIPSDKSATESSSGKSWLMFVVPVLALLALLVMNVIRRKRRKGKT